MSLELKEKGVLYSCNMKIKGNARLTSSSTADAPLRVTVVGLYSKPSAEDGSLGKSLFEDMWPEVHNRVLFLPTLFICLQHVIAGFPPLKVDREEVRSIKQRLIWVVQQVPTARKSSEALSLSFRPGETGKIPSFACSFSVSF